jgi:hypothetical protein
MQTVLSICLLEIKKSKGVVPDDTYHRNTFRVNASKNIGKVSLSATTSYFTDKTNVVGSTIGIKTDPYTGLF